MMLPDGELAPPATLVPELVAASRPCGEPAHAERSYDLIRTILRRRNQFGITRMGSVTRLDRIGIPVVQVVRPLALSNAVNQGKGLSHVQAAASGLMEALETWAAERIPQSRCRKASFDEMPERVCDHYAPWIRQGTSPDWRRLPLAWLDGWDLFSGGAVPTPAALVDTIYTIPSPHPYMFPRTTTGLGAGSTMARAIVKAATEVLERDAVSRAHAIPHFFDRWRIDEKSIRGGEAAEVLSCIDRAKLMVGIWRVPTNHALPVYWCHVMEREAFEELAPLPAQGFGCDASDDAALSKALLEACQVRLTAISGAREDVTRRVYPREFDRAQLAEWRQFLAGPARTIPLRAEGDLGSDIVSSASLDDVIEALCAAGAQAALVVPLFSDVQAGIHIVRLVAPPLRLTWQQP
jgi:ribosomal protein S12 methylthiotransferase accessory factor